MHLRDAWLRPLARQVPATCLEDVEAASVFGPCTDVRTVDAVVTEQQRRHAADRRRAVHLEIRNPIGAHVPALQDEARVVHAVVVVEMAEERMRHVAGPSRALEKPMMRARVSRSLEA